MNSTHLSLRGDARTMSTREIAELTGKQHKHVLEDARNMLAELGLTSAAFSADLPDAYGRPQPVLLLPKRECLILISGYSITMRARIIDRWQELEAGASPSAVDGTPADSALKLLGIVADVLRLPPSGRLGMVRQCIGSKAPDLLPMIPAYAVDAPSDAAGVSSEPTKAATELLKQHGSKLTVVAFNTAAIRCGLLAELHRPSRSAGQKRYLSFTEAGLAYGKNVVSPANPRETQPHWYVSRFGDALALVEQEGGAA